MTSSNDAILSIVKMGFNEELVKKAYKTNGNDSEKTINFLTKLKKRGGDYTDIQSNEDGSEYEVESSFDDDPLGFMKTTKKLKALKNIVYQEVPEEINSVISSVMDAVSMDDWEEITNNEEAFLDLLCDNQEIKDIEKLKCEKLITAADKKGLEKIKSLGFPDYIAEQALFACNKNTQSAIKLLSEN